MPEIREKIRSLLTPILQQHQAFLTDVVVRNERGGKLVQVFLDTDAGVTIEQCAEVSRELAVALEKENVFETSYRLEVSSPGIDRPLTLLRQYHKNVGRRFKVTYERSGTRSSFVGSLTAIEDDRLTFLPDKGGPFTVQFEEIVESRVELPW